MENLGTTFTQGTSTEDANYSGYTTVSIKSVLLYLFAGLAVPLSRRAVNTVVTLSLIIFESIVLENIIKSMYLRKMIIFYNIYHALVTSLSFTKICVCKTKLTN